MRHADERQRPVRLPSPPGGVAVATHHYAIFSAQYRPHAGGVETFTENLATELVATGQRATVVTSRLDASPEHEVEPSGVGVFRLPCLSLMGGRLPLTTRTSEYRRLFSELLDLDIDRVLINARFYSHSLEGLRFAAEAGAPAVVLDHGSAWLTLGNPVADVAVRAYEKHATKKGLRFSPTYAGISRASAGWLRTFGIETDLVIPNSIDAPAYRALASARDFRAEFGVPEGALLIAFVGRLTPEKGADILVDAARQLWEESPGSFCFILAGEGFLRSSLERDLPSCVRLLGNVERSDVSALLSQADAFCLPTRSEGFCMALLEAGAWGTYPIITRTGVVDEVLGGDSRLGCVLPDRSVTSVVRALRDLMSTPRADREEASALLRNRVESSWSWADSVRALDEAFSARA